MNPDGTVVVQYGVESAGFFYGCFLCFAVVILSALVLKVLRK